MAEYRSPWCGPSRPLHGEPRTDSKVGPTHRENHWPLPCGGVKLAHDQHLHRRPSWPCWATDVPAHAHGARSPSTSTTTWLPAPTSGREPVCASPPTASASKPAVTLTGGNRDDSTQLLALLDAVAPIGGLRGRLRRKPRRLDAPSGLHSASSVTAASGDRYLACGPMRRSETRSCTPGASRRGRPVPEGRTRAGEGMTDPNQVWSRSRSLSAAPTSGQFFRMVSRKARSTGE